VALTYTQLVDAVQDYTSNYEPVFVSHIPTFIRQAEQRIYNVVQHPKVKKNATATLTSGVRYLSTPTDFLSPFELAIIDADGAYHQLLQKDVSWIREAFPDPAEEGIADYYAIFDQDSFILSRTPDANYTAELHYFTYPQSLVDAGDSNTTWLSTNFDSALLYGTLVDAYGFMKGEPDMMAFYEKQYKEALGLFKILGDGKNRQDAYRTVQTRIGVP
jgi:hypothetical protein